MSEIPFEIPTMADAKSAEVKSPKFFFGLDVLGHLMIDINA